MPLLHATFGMGSGLIVESIRCSGMERRLKDCFIRDISDGECNHNEDAGVRCCKTPLWGRSQTIFGKINVTVTLTSDPPLALTS